MTETTKPIAEQTPREIDEALSQLHEARAKVSQHLNYRFKDLSRKSGWRPNYRKSSETTPAQKDFGETLALVRAKIESTPEPSKTWAEKQLTALLTDIDDLKTKIKAMTAEIEARDAEYSRRPWTRFFQVTSSANGHIHKNMGCSTCRWTTTYGWNPRLSGKTESEAVNDLGPNLCTVCYPSAPVEWTVGLKKPAGCAGSGKAPEVKQTPNPRSRTGFTRRVFCSVCGERATMTSRGVVRKHAQSKDLCPGSGKVIGDEGCDEGRCPNCSKRVKVSYTTGVAARHKKIC